MSNYYERENSYLKNALGFLIQESSEQEIYNDFIRHFAAGDGSNEDLGGETAQRNPQMEEPDELSAKEQEAEKYS